jgi:hypothetical protein
MFMRSSPASADTKDWEKRRGIAGRSVSAAYRDVYFAKHMWLRRVISRALLLSCVR